MACKSYETTNEALDKVLAALTELQSWAIADSEHAADNEALDTYRDDRIRVVKIRRALRILAECKR